MITFISHHSSKLKNIAKSMLAYYKRLTHILFIVISIFSLSMINHTVHATDSIGLDTLSKQEQVDQLSKLCWKYREKNTPKALNYGLKGIEIAEKEGIKSKLGILNNYVGVIYQHYMDDIHTAIRHYDMGLHYSLRKNDSIEIAYVYNNMGDAFYKIGNIPLALEYAKKSMKIFEQLKNKRGIAYSYINMGSLKRANKEYISANNYFFKAIDLRKTINDSVGIASAYLEVGNTYFLMENFEKALTFFSKSYENNKAIDNKTYMAYSLHGIGNVYMQMNELDSAYTFFKSAQILSQEKKDLRGIINSKLGLVKVYGKTGKVKEGKMLLNNVFEEAKKEKKTTFILDVLKTKADFFQQIGDYEEATVHYKKYITIYDSLLNELQFQTLSEIKHRFEVKEKLNQTENDLAAKQKTQIYSLSIIILLTAFTIIIIFRHKKINRLRKELLASNKTKDKIFSIISHDLISPFNVLVGTSELLVENIDNKDLKNASNNAQIMLKASNEGYYFISNLLHWARSQQAKIVLQKETFNIQVLFKEITSMLRQQAKLKQINVEIATGYNNVYADKNLIQIVILNLMNNALKFTEPGGTVILESDEDENQAFIYVKDNGVGIPKEKMNRMFKKEPTPSTRGTQNEKGTGLGLKICKEFVQMHNGEIFVKSRPGGGSIFWISLPKNK